MDKELRNYMNDILDKCLDKVAIRVQEELRRCIIEYVYNPMEPTVYERTWQFYDSFIVELSQKLTKRIFHDSSILKWNGNKYQHGSSERSRTDIIAQILNDNNLNGYNSEFGGALNIEFHNQGYWDAFLDILDREFDTWCQEEMNKILTTQ